MKRRIGAIMSRLCNESPAQSTKLLVNMRTFLAVALMAISMAAQTPPGARMGRPAERWLAPLSTAERNQPELRAGLTRASVHRAAPGDWLAQGQWSRTADGKALYRAALRSPEALGLRLHFRNLNAGEGRVWMYPADGVTEGYFAGPYTARGVFGDGEFWSEFVEGESVVLEYETSREGKLPFEVDVVSHVLHEVVPGTGKASTRREALSCNKDAMCHPEWAERARSVGRYLFETNGGGALCSGSVVSTRNSSRIPYFLTADHCVSNAAEARSVQVFWGYTSLACGGAPRNLRQLPTTLGATYLTGGGLEQGDFTLLRLNGTLPDTVTFSGWTPDDHPVGGDVTGIHHPGGDFQRISFGSRGDAIPVRGRPEGVYYTINWREGVTEGGSSGSPLFNADGLIVGMLSGGPKLPSGKTECDLNPAFDWYGRFSTAYPSLQAFLEERTTGGGTPPPPPPSGGGTSLTNNTAATFRFAAVDGPTLMSGAGTYRIEVPQGATRLEIRVRTTTPNADVDLFVRAGSAPEVDGGRVTADYSAETESGNETVAITPTSNPPLRAGAYFATLAVFTPGVAVEGTITAVITTGGGGGGTPATGAQALTSGQVRNITIEPVTGPQLLTGASSYSISVPAGATRLEIRLETDNRSVDVDLYARFGDAVTIANGAAVADHRSEGPDGNETIVITPASSPALRPGTYFIHLGVFSINTRITSRLTATVTGGSSPPPAGSGGTLNSGVPATYSVGPVTSPSLVGTGYQIAVPAGATRLELGCTGDVFGRTGDFAVAGRHRISDRGAGGSHEA
ncbi:MAG: trypsin-like serine protease [Acidobacteria bacterium]|nr:trypsin-like serine protease [Acidobacteriota bacterium]